MPEEDWSPKTQAIVRYRRENFCLDMQDVADKFGVSREWVRQVCERAGVQTTAAGWGTKDICPKCGEHKNECAVMCRKCRHEAHIVPLTCSFCGKIFERGQSLVLHCITQHNQELFFCNKHCQGMWLATNYGIPPQYTPEQRKEQRRARYAELKKDPVRYAAWLQAARDRYAERMKDPVEAQHIRDLWTAARDRRIAKQQA